MNKIFIGMAFLFLDLNLSPASFTINLLPDFAGYLFLLYGFYEMRQESKFFEKCSALMAVFTFAALLRFIMDFLDLTANVFVNYAAGLLETVLTLLTAFLIAREFKRLEQRYRISLCSAGLIKFWALNICFQIMALTTSMILLLCAASSIAAFVCGIFYLFKLNMARINWYNGRTALLETPAADHSVSGHHDA